MPIVSKNAVICDYTCSICFLEYREQRNVEDHQFFINCQKTGCTGEYVLVSESYFTYDQYIPEPDQPDIPEPDQSNPFTEIDINLQP